MKTKNLPFSDVQFKALKNREFEGYASTFGNVDAHNDIVMPGAFTETLKDRERPIKMRDNHFGPVIGKYTEIIEDSHGLYVRGELTPGHAAAEDRYASMKHGVTDSMSIGYTIIDQTKREDGINELNTLHLVEISVVDEPANVEARVAGIKHLLPDLWELKDFEGLLRDVAGFSRKDATALVSRFKSVVLGEQGQENPADELLAAIQGIKLNKQDD